MFFVFFFTVLLTLGTNTLMGSHSVNYSRSSGYLTSTTTWSYADGYYVIRPNDNIFYYPFPCDNQKFRDEEIAWVTYEDLPFERDFCLDRLGSDQIKENGLAFIAACIQDLRFRCYRRAVDY